MPAGSSTVRLVHAPVAVMMPAIPAVLVKLHLRYGEWNGHVGLLITTKGIDYFEGHVSR